MEIKFKVEYSVGEMVFLRTDPEQTESIVMGYQIGPGLEVKYILRCGTFESLHHEIELSGEKDIIKSTSN